MSIRPSPKICVGASAGGHTNELLALLKAADRWPVKPSVYITTLDIVADSFASKGRVYVIGECDRRHPGRALGVLMRAVRCALKERPDVVITTGSLPLAMVCFFTKLLGSKIIWIDSVAQMEDLSVSGRFVRLFADICLSQWPEVAQKYRNVEYVGEVL